MKDILNFMKQLNTSPNYSISLCGKLEYFVGNYFVSGAGDPYETIYAIYFDNTISREECVEQTPEKLVAYVTADYKYAFVLTEIYDKFIKDTSEYGFIYIPVSDFSAKEFFIDLKNDIPAFLQKITWLNDDFLDDENIEFDFETFFKIDEGTEYINPNHFSINELVVFLKILNQKCT